MDLRHLRYFVVLAETLHFGRAAEKLHIAQPALSIQIRDLEEMLGGKLFDRTKRRVALTEAGNLFLVGARATLAEAERAIEMARRALGGYVGTVRVAFSGNAISSGVLGRVLRAFNQERPDVEVVLQELDPRSQINALARQDIQFAFLTALSMALPDEMRTLQLAAFPLRIVVPVGHRFETLASIPLSALKDEPFVVYAGVDGDDGTAIIQSLAGFVPRILCRASSIMMVVGLVGAGRGLTLLPASLEHFAAQTGVVFKPISNVNTDMDISLVHLRSEKEPAALAFLACVQSLLCR